MSEITPDPERSATGPAKRILRSRRERMVAGIAGGLAEYFGVDSTLVRLGFVLLTFAGGAGAIAYVVAWAIIAEAER